MAQLDRASVYGTEGRAFESLWARISKGLAKSVSPLVFSGPVNPVAGYCSRELTNSKAYITDSNAPRAVAKSRLTCQAVANEP